MSNRRYDPQQLGPLRRRFVNETKKRFRLLANEIYVLVYHNDVFGIGPRRTPLEQMAFLFNASAKEWATHDPAAKHQAFMDWLESKSDQLILEDADEWMQPYIRSAYLEGVRRVVDLPDDPFAGFTAPKSVKQTKLLYNRAYQNLKGVTLTAAQQLSNVLALGFAEGKSPRDLARELSKTVESLLHKRALTIARTELAYAYAEGQLDGFENDKQFDLQIEAEWSTAGDDRVCPACFPLDGMVFKLEKARGMIPLHPNCRCAWLPVVKQPKRTSKV